MVNVIATEHLLKEAWSVLEDVRANKKLTDTACNVLFGTMCARVILFVLKKQKDGYEYQQAAIVHGSFKEIKEKFLVELQKASMGRVTVPEPTSSASPIAERPVDLASASDPAWIATHAGWTPNGLFVMRCDPNKVYKLVEFTEHGAHFVEEVVGPHAADKIIVTFDDLPKMFKPFRGKLQEKLVHDVVEHRVDISRHYLREIERAKIFLAFCKAAMSHAEAEPRMLQYYINPPEVRVKVERVGKGELQIMPVTELQKISQVASPSSVEVTSNGFDFHVSGPTQQKTNQTPLNKNIVFSAFWRVKRTDDASQANLRKTKVNVDGIVVPMYENTKVLKEFDELIVFIPSQPPAKRSKA